MKTYTQQDVIDMLDQRRGGKSWGAMADEIGVSRQFLGRVTSGRAKPGDKVLFFLDLAPATVYTRINSNGDTP